MILLNVFCARSDDGIRTSCGDVSQHSTIEDAIEERDAPNAKWAYRFTLEIDPVSKSWQEIDLDEAKREDDEDARLERRYEHGLRQSAPGARR